MKISLTSWFGPQGGRRWWLLVGDILLIILSYALAIAARTFIRYYPDFTPVIIDDYLKSFFYTLPLLVVIRVAFFGHFGLYRSGWRYAGLRDSLRIVQATTLSSIVFIVCVVLTANTLGVLYASSNFIADWLLITIFIIVTRFSMRIKKELLSWKREGKTNVLIVGAGSAGVLLLREIVNNPALNYFPRGFIDDDTAKQGMIVQGIPVIGNRQELPTLIHTLFIEEVLIAIPSASGKAIREIIETCNTMGVKFKTLPSVTDIVDGKVTISDLRDVDIMDILRRDPISLDTAKIKNSIEGKVILVTGGGGSIGSELCRQIANYKPKELVIVELSEFNLYQIDKELKHKSPELKIFSYIADIKNETRLKFIFEQHKPDYVFHAAAYKHVPIMEQNPVEAVLNNIKGTMHAAQAADKFGCGEFVMVSTDKAVKPSSIMGATKRVAEMYVQSFNTISNTNFISVRFGNVLDSSGSVLPLFKEQIIRGGPVTVTHPEITRYFMLIPEASQLVLEAATFGIGGEIFILDMGEPVKIIDLARNLIQLMGKQPGQDISIKFTGLRPGEKLHEELVYDGSEQPTKMEKIMVTRSEPRNWDDVHEKVCDIIAVASVNNVQRTYECLQELVPEYKVTKNEK